jgi:hypothetical protein
MKPPTLTLTVALPDDPVERLAVYSMTLAELLGCRELARPRPLPNPPAGPPAPRVGPSADPDADDEPPDIMREPGTRPMSGSGLATWIQAQPGARELHRRAQALGRKHGYGWRLTTWRPDQAARVYEELTAPGWGESVGRRAQ